MATFQERIREIVSRSVANACATIARDLPAKILADPNYEERGDGGAGWIDDGLRPSESSVRDGTSVFASSAGEGRGPKRVAVESDANEMHGIAKTLVSIRNTAEERTTNEPVDSDAAPARSGPATSVSHRPLSTLQGPTERSSSEYCRIRTANESTEAAPAKAVLATSRHAVSPRSLWIRQERMKAVSPADCRLPQVPAECVPERIRNAAAIADKKEEKKEEKKKEEKKKAVKAIGKRKARGCGRCDGCIRQDCGKCAACLDKTKFGGANRKKQRCVHRTCTDMAHVWRKATVDPRDDERRNAIEKNLSSEDRKISASRGSHPPWGSLSPWTEALIEELIRIRREEFNNKNSWTDIAALISKPGGFRWQATHLANLVGAASFAVRSLA